MDKQAGQYEEWNHELYWTAYLKDVSIYSNTCNNNHHCSSYGSSKIVNIVFLFH